MIFNVISFAVNRADKSLSLSLNPALLPLSSTVCSLARRSRFLQYARIDGSRYGSDKRNFARLILLISYLSRFSHLSLSLSLSLSLPGYLARHKATGLYDALTRRARARARVLADDCAFDEARRIPTKAEEPPMKLIYCARIDLVPQTNHTHTAAATVTYNGDNSA